MKIEIIKSQKDSRKIIYNNYICNYCFEDQNFISWRCMICGCSGRIRKDISVQSIVEIIDHWHESDKNKLAWLKPNLKTKDAALFSNENFDNALIQATEGIETEMLKNF